MNKTIDDIASLFTDGPDIFDPEYLRVDGSLVTGGKAFPKAVGKSRAVRKRAEHIGCPVVWFDRVYSSVKSKGELAVALLLYRERFRQWDGGKRTPRADVVPLSNCQLAARGISRQTKYNALARLEAAGVISVDRKDGASLRVVFND